MDGHRLQVGIDHPDDGAGLEIRRDHLDGVFVRVARGQESLPPGQEGRDRAFASGSVAATSSAEHHRDVDANQRFLGSLEPESGFTTDHFATRLGLEIHPVRPAAARPGSRSGCGIDFEQSPHALVHLPACNGSRSSRTRPRDQFAMDAVIRQARNSSTDISTPCQLVRGCSIAVLMTYSSGNIDHACLSPTETYLVSR